MSFIIMAENDETHSSSWPEEACLVKAGAGKICSLLPIIETHMLPSTLQLLYPSFLGQGHP